MTRELIQACEEKVIQPTLKGMAAEGAPYKGILYVGLMMTPEGPKVVEYNCRLGDPEAQVVLPLLEGDALDLFELAAKGEIRNAQVKNKAGSAAIVVLAAAGYPGSYPKGDVITGVEQAAKKVQVIHAGTRKESDHLVTSGGRVLGIVGEGKTLKEALDSTYEGVSCVHFQGMQYRKDIGKKGLQRCSN
jgi:phosphoribosylamine--glycine ligase